MTDERHSSLSTGLGIVALLLWSTTVAFLRGLSERIGIFDTVGFTMIVGGGLGLAYLAATRQFGALARLSRGYLGWGLLLFLAYMVSFNLAIARAGSREVVLEAGLINYLWPGLTLAFAVPLQKKRATPWLAPGILLAFAGVALAMLGTHYALDGVGEKLRQNAPVYLLALTGAVTWALFSNLSRVWAKDAAAGATPLFLFVSGLVMAGVGRLFPFQAVWTPVTWSLLLFVALGPTLLSYAFWEYGMRKGHLVLLASLSFFTPLFSTLISSAFLGVKPEVTIWYACALVIAGAAVCNASVKDL